MQPLVPCWAWVTRRAVADEAARELIDRLASWREAHDAEHLLVLACTPHHARRLADLADAMRAADDRATAVVACVTSGLAVAGADAGRGPAVGAWALPGAGAQSVALRDTLTPDGDDGEALANALGLRDEPASGLLVLGDAPSTPTVRLLPALAGACGEASVLGALLPSPDGDRDAPAIALADDNGPRTMPGGVAIALRTQPSTAGLTPLLAQACRPVGSVRTATRTRGTMLLDLDGHAALDTFRRAAGDDVLDGWCIAIIPGEGDRPGRDGVVVREIRGTHEDAGAVVLPEPLPEGARVQLHRPDPETAAADLELLLDTQRLHGPASGALLVRSAGRPGPLYADATRVERAFAPPVPGPERARAGKPVDPDAVATPVLMIESVGEIAGGAGGVRVHALTTAGWVARASGG